MIRGCEESVRLRCVHWFLHIVQLNVQFPDNALQVFLLQEIPETRWRRTASSAKTSKGPLGTFSGFGRAVVWTNPPVRQIRRSTDWGVRVQRVRPHYNNVLP